jgi:hypothetical protein
VFCSCQFQCQGVNKHSGMHDINIEISDLPFFWKKNELREVGSRKALLNWMPEKKVSSQTKDQDPAMCSNSSFTHVWHYSPCWIVASLKRHLRSCISPFNLLRLHTPGICNAFFWTTSYHLILGFPTALVLWDFPLRIFFGILSSSILMMWPAHPNLLILVLSTIIRS